MKWGHVNERGCKAGQNCKKGIHPRVCHNSLKLKCDNTHCTAKLHVTKCKRACMENNANNGGILHTKTKQDGLVRGPGRSRPSLQNQTNEERGPVHQPQAWTQNDGCKAPGANQNFLDSLTIQQVLEETRKMVQQQLRAQQEKTFQMMRNYMRQEQSHSPRYYSQTYADWTGERHHY